MQRVHNGLRPSFFASGSTAGILEWAGQVMKRAPVFTSTRQPHRRSSALCMAVLVVVAVFMGQIYTPLCASQYKVRNNYYRLVLAIPTILCTIHGMKPYIEKYRRKMGLTKTDLGKLWGVSQGYISHLEAGIRKPGRHFAAEIETLTGGAITRHQLRPDIFKRNSNGNAGRTDQARITS